MKKRFLKIIIIIIISQCVLSSCQLLSDLTEQKGIKSIKIFQSTDAWELAQAVNSQNIGKIKKISKKNPEILDIKDPEYETTLLIWAVGMEKYDSVVALLECGADPDIYSVYYGYTALYLAAGFSWIDRQEKKDPKYVKILLEYGADPNLVTIIAEKSKKSTSADGIVRYIDIGASPLMASVGCGLEKTKALIESGANIDHKNEENETAAIKALRWGHEVKYAHYLIVEKNANIKDSYIVPGYSAPNIFVEKESYPIELLKNWVYDIDSDEYKLKMEIVEEFSRQGVDY